MALLFFFATIAAGCRRMLADHVTAEGVEAPRNLEQLDLHFEAGDWAAHGVLLLEADGDVCASGTGGDASDGDFSASWDAPKDGCYRVDAHSAGEQCGFSSPVALNIDWCAGRTETLKYTPGADGWTALGVYPFHPGHFGGVTQKEGAVDAFRVVPVQECKMGENPVFGSITVDTDADEMPEDLAAKLADRVTEMGDALTAFFHPVIEENRRLSVGEKPTNHVVVDFDLAKLGAPYTPTEAAVKEATQLICSMLDTVECGHAASFKLDESGDVKKLRPKPSVRGLVPYAVAALICVSAIGLAFGVFVIARKHLGARLEAPLPAEPKTVFVTPTKDCEDALDEKKPQVEDDNVSTVTPVSLPDSLPSVEDTAADQQV
jgi:hypothetical protein